MTIPAAAQIDLDALTFDVNEAMTLASLMDLATDAFTTACLRPRKDVTSYQERLLEARKGHGAWEFRAQIVALVKPVEAAWDALSDDAQGEITFDFEFCDEALRNRFVDGVKVSTILQQNLIAWATATATQRIAARAQREADKAAGRVV